MINSKKILFVSSEVAPFIKTGGLGDVASALPKELVRLGFDVRVILPKYSAISQNFRNHMTHLGHKTITLAWRNKFLGIDALALDGVTYYFIDNEDYFKREIVYGEFDDCERFGFFSKAVIESFDITGFYPDIIHCNDWHSGMVPVYLNEAKREGKFENIKTIFTIHNLRFQGIFSYRCVTDILGLEPSLYFHEDGIKFHDALSFMKGGINYSNYITTVSKTYAEEIKTKYYGEHLENLFIHQSDKLFGIVNGIDFDSFNPETDNTLLAKYSISDFSNKSLNKVELQKKLHLNLDENAPILSIITRLDKQKGLDLIVAIFDQLILETNIQFVLLGNGERRYEGFFRQKEQLYPGRVSCTIGFNNNLAKEIYAGSDLFLMPSQFEPCGLSQMISMRYGTIPIVRETGGLKDTVEPFNQFTNSGTGFSFSNYNAHDMLHIVKYATSVYSDKNLWSSLIKRAMSVDNSWRKSALEYISLYTNL